MNNGLSNTLKPRVLINTANLHVGGGVQVAASFLNELSEITLRSEIQLSIAISQAVYDNLSKPDILASKCNQFSIVNVHGMDLSFYNSQKDYDVIFTVFGPAYFTFRYARHIVGFAQPWIIYPENEVVGSLSLIERLKSRLLFWVQWMFFKRAEQLVVEAEHVRSRLLGFRQYKKPVSVIPNCISGIYKHSDCWENIEYFEKNKLNESTFKIGYLTRDYPHKNLVFLLNLKKILDTQLPQQVEFYVTLTECELDALGEDFKSNINSVGSLRSNQCPTFYSLMDAVIFPSFLECFSAMPIESMKMRKPVFASDRAFVRDFCGDTPFYFDPLNPSSAAEIICEYLKRPDAFLNQIEDGEVLASKYESPRTRADKYLELIYKVALENE